MDDRRVRLPDPESVQAANVAGYFLEAGGLTVRLWIGAYEDRLGP